MAVHRELGPGFLEPVYQEALSIEFMDRIMPREQAQVMHYLKALKLKTALLINFGSQALQFNRLLNPAFYTSRAIPPCNPL